MAMVAVGCLGAPLSKGVGLDYRTEFRARCLKRRHGPDMDRGELRALARIMRTFG